MQVQYRFSDSEISKLLKENFMIIYDTREQKNQHILDFLDKKKIKYKKKKIDEGDYTAIITARPDMGISRDLYFNVAVERKNSVDELASNLGEKREDYRDDIRLERELKRARQKGTMIYLVVEDKNGMENIEKGNYRSQYGSKAFEAKLASIEVNYLRGIRFVDKKDAGRTILKLLYYSVMEALKDKMQDIKAAEAN
ncbi:ERCC4 domain-containing protein [Clostridium kluyveri]|uniref:ERCC4 domain-containing protein n=2 Tax=Clostridium kluyveri TaxID=1534 RepID=A5F9R1_CLOK5|nr:ERCC4 domain-containing protein [Clostridium kluyveri]ABQ23600.1 conserved hypothetical protein [Clostridium kluyveri DSM 555]BAH08558.1 hypothetical protein CKR_P39 [Clostridium kluyveri NBRC 12016]